LAYAASSSSSFSLLLLPSPLLLFLAEEEDDALSLRLPPNKPLNMPPPLPAEDRRFCFRILLSSSVCASLPQKLEIIGKVRVSFFKRTFQRI
jgi:hypothetical protein